MNTEQLSTAIADQLGKGTNMDALQSILDTAQKFSEGMLKYFQQAELPIAAASTKLNHTCHPEVSDAIVHTTALNILTLLSELEEQGTPVVEIRRAHSTKSYRPNGNFSRFYSEEGVKLTPIVTGRSRRNGSSFDAHGYGIGGKERAQVAGPGMGKGKQNFHAGSAAGESK